VTPLVGVRLGRALQRRVDDYAKQWKMTRSAAVRMLVELGLGKPKTADF
jgi:hypothetical protein